MTDIPVSPVNKLENMSAVMSPISKPQRREIEHQAQSEDLLVTKPIRKNSLGKLWTDSDYDDQPEDELHYSRLIRKAGDIESVLSDLIRTSKKENSRQNHLKFLQDYIFRISPVELEDSLAEHLALHSELHSKEGGFRQKTSEQSEKDELKENLNIASYFELCRFVYPKTFAMRHTFMSLESNEGIKLAVDPSNSKLFWMKGGFSIGFHLRLEKPLDPAIESEIQTIFSISVEGKTLVSYRLRRNASCLYTSKIVL